MTREEAIAELKRDIELDNDFTEDYLNAVNMAIKALEKEDVLDKIRAEIMRKDGLEEALEIIDRYTKDGE